MSHRAGGRKTRGLKALGASSPPISAYGLPSGLRRLQQAESQKATIQSISPKNIPQAWEQNVATKDEVGSTCRKGWLKCFMVPSTDSLRRGVKVEGCHYLKDWFIIALPFHCVRPFDRQCVEGAEDEHHAS